ncbi:S41 family peptidase [Mesonia aestuariivivens]|uniref:Peptidase S41 n=1 Tax=Mesonia aestuariivivens TaxID=2796128 RepID=A0ABS6VYD8_9FLAO|nr:S41 family peptidase [Mesonia aestuariivivens]MBW2960605.1 peptidase S41 [Mesonia aestuariivivens]
MKFKFTYLFFLLTVISLTSCFDDQDDVKYAASSKEIKDFVYRGLDQFYLYKANVDILADEVTLEESSSFINNYNTPEELFDELIDQEKDRFSVIVSDYRELENNLAGISKSNGMKFGLVLIESTNDIFGYVRYILPNTSASDKGVERGMLFNRIDGTILNLTNYNSLLEQENYTIGLATIEDDTLIQLDESINLTKVEYTENPVHIVKTIDLPSRKVGYLMYNAFNRNFDDALNAAFAEFQAENINDLVIDLRYNGGGSIETSNDLASMVTGQFEGEIFTTQVYNQNYTNEERLFNNQISSGAVINSLNLNKLYVLTTGSTASASELLINSLRPYIEVEQIGTNTTGKFQGSVTLYDSPNFSRVGANINHRYAMQPLILKSVNANGDTGYIDGLTPSTLIEEDYANLGELGNPNEPLLAAALNQVSFGRFATTKNNNKLKFKEIGESEMNKPNYQRMYVDDLEK